MYGYKVTLNGAEFEAAEAILDRLASQAQNVSGGLMNIGEALNRTHRQRFEAEQAPDGSHWAPLSGWTLANKRGPGILRESGELLGSMNYQVNGNVLEHGFNKVYAAAQQFGSTHTIKAREGGVLAIPNPFGNRAIFAKSATVHIPARPYSGFGPLEQEASQEAMEEWLSVENG